MKLPVVVLLTVAACASGCTSLTHEQLRGRYGRELEGVTDCTSCVRRLSAPDGAWCDAGNEGTETSWRSCRAELARLERERMGR